MNDENAEKENDVDFVTESMSSSHVNGAGTVPIVMLLLLLFKRMRLADRELSETVSDLIYVTLARAIVLGTFCGRSATSVKRSPIAQFSGNCDTSEINAVDGRGDPIL